MHADTCTNAYTHRHRPRHAWTDACTQLTFFWQYIIAADKYTTVSISGSHDRFYYDSYIALPQVQTWASTLPQEQPQTSSSPATMVNDIYFFYYSQFTEILGSENCETFRDYFTSVASVCHARATQKTFLCE